LLCPGVGKRNLKPGFACGLVGDHAGRLQVSLVQQNFLLDVKGLGRLCVRARLDFMA
jgi:hypothetical protein